MPQTRYPFTQSFAFGSGSNLWQYKISIFRVVNPFPVGTAPETLETTVTIPSSIKIELGALKKSFDLAKLSDGDKVDNIDVKILDDATGTWLRNNIFTQFGMDDATPPNYYVYQLQIQTDKGSGTLQTIFFGEIDTRTLAWEPEYMSADGTLRKQFVSFTATDIFLNTLQSMPFGDNTLYFTNTNPSGSQPYMQAIWGLGALSFVPTNNQYLPPPPAGTQPPFGAMNLLTPSFLNKYVELPGVNPLNSDSSHGNKPTGIFPANVFFTGKNAQNGSDPNYYKSAPTQWWQNMTDDQTQQHNICDSDDGIFARFADVIFALVSCVANRMGGAWTPPSPATQTNAIDFSHVALSYGSNNPAFSRTIVTNLAEQWALHRSMLASYVYECTGPGATEWANYTPPQDYAPAKQGTAWDGLELLLSSFLQYAALNYNDTAGIVTMKIQSPLSTGLAAFGVDSGGMPHPVKVARLKYTPHGFAARSVTGKIINADSTVVNSLTDALNPATLANPTQYPTNNLCYSNPFAQANNDVQMQLCTGTYWYPTITNQLTVFADEITSAPGQAVFCADSNANGEIVSSGALAVYPTINLGFGGALGTYSGLSLTDAVTRALFSLFCGFTNTIAPSGGQLFTVVSKGMEIVEAEFLVDANCPTTDGTFVDTTGIDSALLKTIQLTTDTVHTFIITGIEEKYCDNVRTASITAVRTAV